MAVSVSGERTESMRAQRDRYVAKGVSIQPIFAHSAHGARLTDVDGKVAHWQVSLKLGFTLE